MINLKLAEYKDGKFLRFLKLGNEFCYGGDYITVATVAKVTISGECDIGGCFEKDKTDPLNRFNGLFDGRTYGKGRFVLIMESHIKGFFEDDVIRRLPDSDIISNLHQSPQLFKELNND